MFLRQLHDKTVAVFRETEWTRVVALVALLILGGVWFALSLVDRLWRAEYLTQSGLVVISGPPVTTALSFVFYSASLAAVALSILIPSFRRKFFRIDTSPREAPLRHLGLLIRLRALVPLRPIEWVVVFGTNIGMLGLRFALFPFPQGADTPQYLQAANSILFRFDLGGLSALHAVGVGRWLTVMGVTLLRAILLPLPGETELLTMMVFPILLGVIYSLSICTFVYHLMGDRRLAAWGAILAPISFLTIRLSYDLFAQFLSQSLSILALTGFIAFVLQGRGSPKTTAALYVAALLAHMWTWAVFAALSGVILGWAILAESRGRMPKVQRAIIVLIPSFVGMGLLTIFFSNVQVAALYPYSVGDAQPFSLPEGWLWIGGLESAANWALGILALVVLASRPANSVARGPLLLWTATVSAAVFVTGFSGPFRFLIMYPMPILVVIGMREVSAWLRVPFLKRKLSNTRALVARAAPAIALFLVLMGSVIPWAYVPEWQYFPGDAAYRQLVQIRDQYGYGNGSILILIDQRYYENGFLWASAVTGAQTYPGSLLSLLREDPFRRDLHRWLPPNLNGVTRVLLPSTLYSPDSMETELLSPSKVPDVPAYRIASGFNVSAFLAGAALPLSNSFWTNWTMDASTFDHAFSTANSQLNWTLRAQSLSPETREASYVRTLPNQTAQSLYFLLSGSLPGAEGALEVYSQSGNSTTYALDRVLPRPLLIRLRLPPGEVLASVRVSFWVPAGATSSEGWADISYMGLVSP